MTDCDIRPLKANALRYPDPVRTLILSEPDSLPLNDFLVKSGQWEKLLEMESHAQGLSRDGVIPMTNEMKRIRK